MCSYTCGLDVMIEGGRIQSVDGNPDHPFNQGRLCAKGRAILDWIGAPDRLTRPLKREGSSWRQLSLETALAEISVRLQDILEENRPESAATWVGEGVGFNQGRQAARLFAHSLGSPNYLSNDTLCAVSKKAAVSSVVGAFPLPDLDNTRLAVLWGTNPAASALFLARRIKKAQDRGAALVVVDPRRTAMARNADYHLQLRPGTDGALALGLLQQIIECGALDWDFIRLHTTGFDRLSEYVSTFSPQWVELETGISAQAVREVAGLLTDRAPAVAHMIGVGPEHHVNGFDSIRALGCLMALSGGLDRPGGNYLPDPLPIRSIGDKLLPGKDPLGADRYPVFSEVHGEGHTLEAMRAITHHDPYPLRALVMSGANPVLTNPNSPAVREALSRLDLLVVRDLFMTDTAALAHYVIPAASFLERAELLTNPNLQLLQLSPAIGSLPECQGEYDFWRSLALGVGTEESFSWKSEKELNRWLIEPLGLSLHQLSQHTSGYPYAIRRWEKYAENGLDTPTGKAELFSERLEALGYDPLPRYRRPNYIQARDENYPLTLISGGRQPQFEHSRHRNVSRLRDTARPAAVEIHPDDARRLGLSSGDMVRVQSRMGHLDLPCRLVDPSDILQGVAHIGHGWREANVNLLTPDDQTDPVSGFPPLKSVPVRVVPLDERKQD